MTALLSLLIVVFALFVFMFVLLCFRVAVGE